MNIITIGIDLAKNIFAVHGVNESGKAELVKPKVPRDQLLPLIANLPPCLIGMEERRLWVLNLGSLACSRNMACPAESALTTACRLRQRPWQGYQACRRGPVAADREDNFKE